MTVKQPSFSFGIEEEYFLVDLETRDLAAHVPTALFAACRRQIGTRFSQEYMHAQVEVATPVCTDMHQARQSLFESRQAIACEAAKYGLAPIAASTHPFARWSQQAHADAARYRSIADEFQGVGRRMIINGLHVHVGIASNAERVRVMNGVRPILPLLLALSTSSPFWDGEPTGLKSYRTAINNATPRTGIPQYFEDWRDYQRSIGLLRAAGVIEDGSKIWWDLRPSAKFPTLEMRITDACPLLEDGLCLAALFRCYCRFLSRNPDGRAALLAGQTGTASDPVVVINENRWRAQRYGIDKGLIDLPHGNVVPVGELVDDFLDLIEEDAIELDCVRETEHARIMIERGTSADRQLALYRRLREQGQTSMTALRKVVDMLVDETAAKAAAHRKRSLRHGSDAVPAVSH